MASKVVVLDRDGVINEDRANYVTSLEEFSFIPGSLEAMVTLSQNGWRIFIMTNQAGIGKGVVSMANLTAIHQHIYTSVQQKGGQVEAILFCPHTDADACECRKPKPGMLLQLQNRLGLASLQGVILVGDSLRDLQAAQAAGCQMHLVRTGHGEETLLQEGVPVATMVHRDLAAFAAHLLS